MDLGVDAAASRPLQARCAFDRRHRSGSNEQENRHRTRRWNRLSLRNCTGRLNMLKSSQYSRGDSCSALEWREESHQFLEHYYFERYVLRSVLPRWNTVERPPARIRINPSRLSKRGDYRNILIGR